MKNKSLTLAIQKLLSESEYQQVINLIRANHEKASWSYYACIQEYCHRKLGTNIDAPQKKNEVVSSGSVCEEDKHLLSSNFNIVLFVGRFRSVTGYGKATRDFFSSLFANKPSNYKVVGLDSQNLNLLGDTESVKTTINGNEIEVSPVDAASVVHVIYHELCDNFNRIHASGKSTFSAWTIQEHSSMIFGKDNLLGLPQHIFVASEWNKTLLTHRGYASDFISVVPHIAPIHRKNNFNRPRSRPCITFLVIMSNVERKNIRNVLSAFIDISNNGDSSELTLTLKMPKNLSNKEIVDKVLPSGIFSLNSLPSCIKVIQEKYTDAEMHHLVESHDCIINVESLKGFDLDTLYALSCGKQAISTLSGGNAEYQNNDNSYIVKQDLPQVFSKFNYTNQLYSKVVAYEPTINSIINRIFDAIKDMHNHSPKNTPKLAFELSQRYSSVSIGALFYSNILQRSHDYDVFSLEKAKIKYSLESKDYKPKEFISDKMSEQQIVDFQNDLKFPSDYPSIEDWLKDRRKQVSSIHTLPLSQVQRDKLQSIAGIHKGKRCFVLGNAPSLNKTDLSKLKNEFTFCANKFYYKLPELNWTPSFYTCLDWTVTPDDAPNLQKFFNENPDILKFIPTRFMHLFQDSNSIYFYNSKPAGSSLREKFEPNALHGVRGGGTVATAMIQLAAHMGFTQIYLVGVDVTYKIPDSVIQEGPDKFKTGTKLYLKSTKDDDPNHFCSNYFGKGAKWHDPNVPEMKRGFRNTYLAAYFYGINVVNATVGGELNQIPRVEYNSLF